MSVHTRKRFIQVPLLLLAISLLLLTAASPYYGPPSPAPLTVTSVEALGLVTFPTGYQFAGTEVGGLSGVTYDANRGVYYVLSDDRGEPHYYTVDIDLSDGSLDTGDVSFLEVTYLRDQTNLPFEPGFADPESIELLHPGQLFISSEGDADASPPIDPFVERFNPTGKLDKALSVPYKFLPNIGNTQGIRDNLAFESLTSAPDRSELFTATENALVQDGPISTLTDYSPSRLLEYELGSKKPGAEYVYMVNPIPQAPIPAGAFADNGLSDMLAIDNAGTFIAMERSYAVGVGNTVVLFETNTRGATNVADIFSLQGVSYDPMEKHFLADFEQDLGIVPDNLEGLGFGPRLPDGRMTLVVVSDNNFNPTQTTQFIVLAVGLE
jgi:hypothetical protein